MGNYTTWEGEFVLHKEPSRSDEREIKDFIDQFIFWELYEEETDPKDYSWFIRIKTDDSIKYYECDKHIKQIVSFINDKGYLLNGEIGWEGSAFDAGRIVINNNEIKVYDAIIEYKLRE